MARIYRKLPELTPQDIQRFWSKVDKTPGQGPNGDCWEWKGQRTPKGYADFRMPQRHIIGSRISYFLATGVDLLQFFACHHCDNPSCVNPQHVFKGTHKQNLEDAAQKGRTASGDKNISRKHPEKFQGEKNGRAKLTNKEVTEIRSRYVRGMVSQQSLAIEYGVSQPMIGYIVRGDNWKNR